jgi:hypothetical protein
LSGFEASETGDIKGCVKTLRECNRLNRILEMRTLLHAVRRLLHRYDYPGLMKACFGKVIFDSEIEDSGAFK